MRLLLLLALVACTKAQPEQPHRPAPADARSGAEPATEEQCEKVLDRFAELEVKREPEGDVDATAAKKAFIVARSRREGFIKLCMIGTSALADCLISAMDEGGQKQCSLQP